MYSSLKLKVSNPGNKIYSVAKTRKHKNECIKAEIAENAPNLILM